MKCPACHVAYAKVGKPAVKSATKSEPEPAFIIYPDIDKRIYLQARLVAVGALLFVLWMAYAAFYVP